MCDYSLMEVPNRLAVLGEELITHRFPTGSMGLASLPDVLKLHEMQAERSKRSLWEALQNWFAGPKNSDHVCAVCIAPGTVLEMSRIPEAEQRQFALRSLEEVTFTQLTAEPFHYRDAIRFHNGRHIMLHRLREGILFKVQSEGADTSSRVIEMHERPVPVGIRRMPA
jgi:hypothetical protein